MTPRRSLFVLMLVSMGMCGCAPKCALVLDAGYTQAFVGALVPTPPKLVGPHECLWNARLIAKVPA